MLFYQDMPFEVNLSLNFNVNQRSTEAHIDINIYNLNVSAIIPNY